MERIKQAIEKVKAQQIQARLNGRSHVQTDQGATTRFAPLLKLMMSWRTSATSTHA